MYDKSDPRASLAPAASAKPPVTAYAPAHYLRFYEGPPQRSDSHSRTWLGRGQNAMISYSEAQAGAEFARKGQVDEWALLLPDPGVKVELTVAGKTHVISGYTLTFAPPGDSVLRVLEGGRIVRLFTTRSSTLPRRARTHPPTANRLPIFRPSRLGPCRPTDSRCAPTVLMCLTNRDALDASGAVRLSWSIISRPTRDRATSPNCHRITMTISSNIRSPYKAHSSITCGGHGRRT